MLDTVQRGLHELRTRNDVSYVEVPLADGQGGRVIVAVTRKGVLKDDI